jgi:uncharacterized protein YkwD
MIPMKAFLLLVTAFFLSAAAAPAQPAGADVELLRAINQARAQYGLPALRVDPRLRLAAQSHSRTLLRTGAFGHGNFARRMTRFGARGPAIGENLAWGVGAQAATSGVLQSWLTSASHRANVLRPGFRRIGIGRAVGTYRGYAGAAVITVDFAGS